MTENSPAPSPARGVYGFALYLGCTSAAVVYFVWAIVPNSILHGIGITYYPQKYWAIALPVYVLMCLALFAFFVYPSLNGLLAPSLESMNTLEDEHSIVCEQYERIQSEGVPPVADYDISHVCSVLYNRKQ